MSALTPDQLQSLRAYWESPEELDLEIIRSLVPYETQQRINQDVAKEMADQGKKVIDRVGVANLWGAEFGNRVHARLRDYGYYAAGQFSEAIHQAVCVKFKYCKRKIQKQFENEPFTLAVAIADSLLPLVTAIPVPITAMSVYLVRHQVLDRWCKCRK